jgi:hypothetical protein
LAQLADFPLLVGGGAVEERGADVGIGGVNPAGPVTSEGVGAVRGSVTFKVVPAPGALCSVSWPPRASTRSMRPTRPVP